MKITAKVVPYSSVVGGMTLRDYFAAQVLAGMDADFSPSGLSWFEQHGASGIYRIADAMIAAREVQL